MDKSIGIVGSGIMGAGIAQIATQNGYPVILTDISETQLDSAVARITNGLNQGVERGFVEATARDNALEILKTTTSLEDVAQSSVVI